jgi:hypothetical protein
MRPLGTTLLSETWSETQRVGLGASHGGVKCPAIHLVLIHPIFQFAFAGEVDLHAADVVAVEAEDLGEGQSRRSGGASGSGDAAAG